MAFLQPHTLNTAPHPALVAPLAEQRGGEGGWGPRSGGLRLSCRGLGTATPLPLNLGPWTVVPLGVPEQGTCVVLVGC